MYMELKLRFYSVSGPCGWEGVAHKPTGMWTNRPFPMASLQCLRCCPLPGEHHPVTLGQENEIQDYGAENISNPFTLTARHDPSLGGGYATHLPCLSRRCWVVEIPTRVAGTSTIATSKVNNDVVLFKMRVHPQGGVGTDYVRNVVKTTHKCFILVLLFKNKAHKQDTA